MNHTTFRLGIVKIRPLSIRPHDLDAGLYVAVQEALEATVTAAMVSEDTLATSYGALGTVNGAPLERRDDGSLRDFCPIFSLPRAAAIDRSSVRRGPW